MRDNIDTLMYLARDHLWAIAGTIRTANARCRAGASICGAPVSAAPILAILDRLLALADGDSGQARHVRALLLAWWNAPDFGGFDPVTLWEVDDAIADDVLAVLGYIRANRAYPSQLGARYDAAFAALAQAELARRARGIDN